MNQRSDIDRVLQVWMDDGPSTMPDRVIDVVADRISVQRQRRSWRLLRRLAMNPIFKLGAAAAAVLVIAVVGYNLLPGPSGPGAGPSPSPSPTPQATLKALPEGPLSGGTYRIEPFRDDPTFSIVADIPAGWDGYPANGAVAKDSQDDLGVLIAFMKADGLHSDPCQWDLDGTRAYDQPGDVVVGPTVDDLVSALKANTSYTSTTPSLLTLGGYDGREIEVQVPADIDMDTCDRETGSPKGMYYVFSGMDAGFYAQGPGAGYRWHLFIVDVGGTRLITAVGYFAETPQADFAAALAIVESFEFTP